MLNPYTRIRNLQLPALLLDFIPPSQTPVYHVVLLWSNGTVRSFTSFVRNSEPAPILAFHQTTFASKIRALETPALTTSLQSLTKPLFVSGYSVPAQLPTPNDQGYRTIPATTYGQQTSQITTSFNILGNLMISS
ncbi:hypothetical protein V495_04276 [Pseudogymnoascus sp. VKM F-4514 (FW-929)]|nr:hypothetical protein V495_04276 [Pseudogymnoascus sp. VKM F-4514 (FW-929)]KFY57316.1 hypothetical protein V497_05620 [Pseudogymnoascus sp. VKM F-4516 (FW-969)]